MILTLVARFLKRKQTLPYLSIKPPFTPAERSFLEILDRIVGEEYRIFGKMRLSDIIKPVGESSGNTHTIADDKVEQKSLDFVICRADDLSPVAVVELTDISASRRFLMKRDDFLAEVLSAAGIRLIRFASPASRSFQRVRDILAENLSLVPPVSKPHLQTSSVRKYGSDILERAPVVTFRVSSEEPAFMCPLCGGKLVMLKSTKGINSGKRFWACTAFPKCTTVIPICQTDSSDFSRREF
ncbi:MAG: hypothetical protein FD174_2775 [Geobacteraceae bacterium]|nr:MAG: hypothetical protein FD174_2775 [Geobacteraceae bacterium]